MRHSFSTFLLAFGLSVFGASLAASGCTVSGFPELPITRDGGDSGGAWMPDAGADDADADAPPPQNDGGGGGPAPVLLGITPTPAAKDPKGPTSGEMIAATLTTVAAGARSAVITRTWSEIAEGGLDDVASQIAFYVKHKRRVLFNLAFVDRRRDARPADIAALSWSDPAVRAALESTIDKILLEIGGGLDILTFGRDVDVFLAEHPADRAAVADLAEHACQYARESPAVPPELAVAVAVSFEGIAAQPDTMKEIASVSDVLALSYIPGQSGEIVAATTEVATHLDQMIAIAAEAGKPIVLQAVGYPSDPAMQSSPIKQQLFFEAFFGALLPRRDAFKWVNIYELHDRWPAACAAYAVGQGEPPDGLVASFVCSLGLFTSAGEEKPAWTEILEGSATFASP